VFVVIDPFHTVKVTFFGKKFRVTSSASYSCYGASVTFVMAAAYMRFGRFYNCFTNSGRLNPNGNRNIGT